MIDSPSLTQFLSSLVIQKHGADISPETKLQFMEELSPRLERWITVKTMEELVKKSPEDMNVFLTMMEQKKPMDEVQKYVEAKIPQYPTALAHMLIEFQSLYLQPVQKA